MQKLSIIITGMFGMPLFLSAQLIGVKNIPGDYPTITAAVTDVNIQGVGADGVIFNITAGYTETLNSVISLTATGTTSNPIVFQKSGTGNNPKIFSYTGGTGTPATAIQDGMWRLIGSDYVTIDGLDLVENPANTSNPSTMEYGFALYKSSASDGAQNNIIKNCNITLNRINNAAGTAPMQDGSIGIYMGNSTATAATTILTPVGSTGTNSNNKFYGNTIQNCNTGIGLSGFAASSPFTLGDIGNDIGGSSAITGNVILNFGGAASATNQAAGIRANQQWNLNVSYNTVDNNDGNGIIHPAFLRGIYCQQGTSANISINSNNLSIKGGNGGALAIENGIGSTANSNTISISNNKIQNGGALAGGFSAIQNTGAGAVANIKNNLVQNNSFPIAVSGSFFYSIYCANATIVNIDSNQVLNNSIGSVGVANNCNFYGVLTEGITSNVKANTISGNMIYNGSGSLFCIRGINTTAFNVIDNSISNNNVPNSSSSTNSLLYGISSFQSASENYINNTINNLSVTGAGTGAGIYGIFDETIQNAVTFIGNNINNLSFTCSTGGGAVLYGIQPRSNTVNVSKNIVHALNASGISSSVVGLYCDGFTSGNFFNNLIGNLNTSTGTGANLHGIYSAGNNCNFYYNTVYLNATSTGNGFGSSAIFLPGAGSAVLKNNIFVNLSQSTGLGLTVALRRSNTALTSYLSASNNNLFYCGTPSPSNSIHFDGTNIDITLAAFKNRVTPRETNSVSEVVSPVPGVYFQSLSGPVTGPSNTFLHFVSGLVSSAESGGIPISGYADDYDGDVRNASLPDIGADEFVGTANPSVYIFTGSGNWNDPANWSNNTIPPLPLPLGKEIQINGTGNCILNIPYSVGVGAQLTVKTGKKLIIQGNFTIQ
ncbi:MAG: hypothetical protein ABJA78_11965 [Ferruginibacter sp.]